MKQEYEIWNPDPLHGSYLASTPILETVRKDIISTWHHHECVVIL